jgi:hypothetical protein
MAEYQRKLCIRIRDQVAPRSQEPSTPLTTEKSSVATQTRPSSPTETKEKSDITVTSAPKITKKPPIVKSEPKKAAEATADEMLELCRDFLSFRLILLISAI